MQILFHFLLIIFPQQKGLCKVINAAGYGIDLMFDGKPFSVLNYCWVTFLFVVQGKLERSWFWFCFFFVVVVCR